MKDLKLPKGIYKSRESRNTHYTQAVIEIDIADDNGGETYEGIVTIWTGEDAVTDSAKEIANVITDGINTYQSTGMTASELVEEVTKLKAIVEGKDKMCKNMEAYAEKLKKQRDELLEALKYVKTFVLYTD